MDTPHTDNRLPGEHAKAIQIACQQFENKLKVAWKRYTIFIEDSERFFIVRFKAISASQQQRGASGGIPEFEVTIRKPDYTVESAYFIR